MNSIYTHENWNLFLKTYFPECKNKTECYKLLAVELNLKPTTIKHQTEPKKELPTWAKAFIFSFINSQNTTKELVVKEVIERINNALNPMKEDIKSDSDS